MQSTALQLAELNNLVRASNGVYQAESSSAFNYSDGEKTEQLLAKIIGKAEDRSSDSNELEEQIVDWPTEYHLTSNRSNLLKPFDLSGVERVLELGCGCGSITRYLSEQQSIAIDAVEGSPSRAALAALRCEGQDNVAIHTGNFNQMVFPEDTYDLVLFVGVTEYAGRFSKQTTDQAALQDLLALAKRALKPEGVALIAIENRLGLKYLMGASEDHYGEPWIGLDDYLNSTGIRTYCKTQWDQQIVDSEFSYSHFCYPFPDYKVPTLVINETATNFPEIIDSLAKVSSRDYLREFSPSINEANLWRGIVQAKSLEQFSNSYIILLGDNPDRLSAVAKFSQIEFDGPTYDWHSAKRATTISAPNKNASDKHKLQQQIAKLEERNQQLIAKLDLLQSSKGWRFLSRLRRLFGQHG